MTARDEVLAIIEKYVADTGRRWFTYDSILSYIRKRRLSSLKDESILRTIRKLAAEGVLKKQYYRRNGVRAAVFMYDV